MICQIQLPKDLEERLEKISQQTKFSKEQLMIEALEQYLDDVEAILNYEQQKHEGTLQTYTLEEVMQRCGITKEDLKDSDSEDSI